MKRILLIILLAAAATIAANAQDIITKVDGTQISAKVVEVNPGTVKYNRTDNPGGPVYVIFISDIHTIKYGSGLVETYNDLKGEAPAEAVENAAALTVPADSVAVPENRAAAPEENAAEAAGRAPQPLEPQGNDEPWWEYEPQRTPVTSVRYRDIADCYDTRDYVEIPGDPYIPALSGLASFFLPGLGQCIDGEWGRGLGIVAANVGFGVLGFVEVCTLFYAAEESTQAYKNAYGSRYYYYDDPHVRLDRANVMFGATLGACVLTLAAQTAFNIWNIFDAVDIAKVKDMYYHDSQARNYASFDMNLSPQLAFAPTAGGTLQPTAGLSLTVSF
ncbi:MAG: hypothetical protein IK031_05755 [Bacteroidales bacterium]|nr:hypothetical protein [Bacteroidales bacterium]